MDINITTSNSKVKRFALTFVMGLLVLFSGVLAACGTNVNSLKLEPSVSEVVLYLDENEGDRASLSVLASGTSEDVLKDLYIHSSSSSLNIENQEYLGSGKTSFDVVGVSQETNITVSVQSRRNLKKITQIKVDVIEPVVSLSRVNSPYKNFVVKGSSTLLDNSLINFNPSHTFEKGIEFAIKDNPAPDQIRIVNNRLVVDASVPSQISKIEITANSTHRQITALTFEYNIIDAITKDNVNIFAQTSGIDLSEEGEEEKVLYIARNSGNIQNEVIDVFVESNQTVEVNAILVDKFGNAQSQNSNQSFAEIVRKTFDPGSKTYSFEISPGKQSGEGYIYFEIELVEFGYKYSTLSNKTKILSYDIVKNILVNNQIATESAQYDIFSEYAAGFAGHEFVFSALPITVADEYKNFYIETADYNPENIAASRIFVYTRNKQTNQLELLQHTDGRLKIEDGESVFVLANKDNLEGTASMQVVSEFSAAFYFGTDQEKRTRLDFNIIRGVSAAEIYGFNSGQDGIVLNNRPLANNHKDEQKVYFAVSGKDAQILNHTKFTVEGNFEVVADSLKQESFDPSIPVSEMDQKALWSVNIRSLADGVSSTGKLIVDFGNGRGLTFKVSTASEFAADILEINAQRPYENSSVGFYQQSPNDFASFTTAIRQGASSKIDYNIDSKTFNANYTYLNAPYSEDPDSLYQRLQSFDKDAIEGFSTQFVSTSNILKSADLDSYAIISGLQIGRVVVRAVYSGKKFETQGLYQVLRDLESPERPVKYFIVETYTPIVNFDARISNNLLYSADTVGFYNKSLSQTTVITTLNYGFVESTYKNIEYSVVGLVENEHVRVEKSEFNNHLYTITALKSGGDGSIEFRITELGQTRVVRIPLLIRDVEKVSGIILENVNEEDGIYMHVDRDTTFRINAKAENLTAFNSKFVYSFEADIGTPNANDILTINENTGLITLKGNMVGGTGIIKVIPQDAFVVNQTGQKELSSANQVAKAIKIVIADGKSKETATRISSLTEIDNTDQHYVLTSNISITNWAGIESFSGGLYGRLSQDENIVQITFNSVNAQASSALFGTIEESGVVEDLILVGEVSGNSTGFVANENYGTISNVFVDTKTDTGTYSASALTSNSDSPVGGIVGTNFATGVIKNSGFFGRIVASNTLFAGGIAGENQGVIENSKVEFYTFDLSQFGRITASKATVGGVVGKLNNGKIVQSYAYSYHNENSVVGLEAGAIVGEISGQNAQISKSFARTNAQYFTATVQSAEDHTQVNNITNSYMFYYQPAETEEDALVEIYRVVGPTRKVAMNAPKYSFGSQTFASTYQAYDINFASSSAWTYSVANNRSFPHLKDVLNEQASLNPNLTLIAGSNLLVDEQNNKAVFFFYEPVGGTVSLTQQEQAVIKNLNTHSFKDIFGITNSTGIKAVVSNGSNLIRTNSNSLELLGTTNNLLLSVFSKYDYTTKVDFEISVVYAPGAFSLTIDNSPVLRNSVISVKGGLTQVVNAEFVSQRVLTTRQISFIQNNNIVSEVVARDIDGTNIIISTTDNVHVIDTAEFNQENFVRFAAFAKNKTLQEDSYINNLLKQATNVNFALSTYMGPFEIDTNVKEIIRTMPYDKVNFDVEVITDNPNEEIELIIKDENGLQTFNNIMLAEIFEQNDFNQNAIKQSVGNGRYKFTYKITLEIKDQYKNLNFNNIMLNIEIKSKEFDTLSKHISMIVASQEIQYINVFARELSKYTTEDGFVFKDEVSNNIAPGKNALLTLDLFPKLAYFDTIEITSSTANGQRISFSVLELNQENKLYRMNSGFKAVSNGISVNQTALQSGVDQAHISTLYIYATVPSTVQLETTFTVSVKAYGADKEILTSSDFIIVAKPLIAATITVNNASSAVVAKGTSAQVVVEMDQNQWLGNDGNLDIIIDKSLSDTAYFEGISITKPIETVNEALGKRTYTAQVEVSVLSQFFDTANHSVEVVATVERRVGNVIETVSSSVLIYVVDFLVDFSTFELKTESLTENRIETYIGISKSLEFDVQTTTWERKGAVYPEVDQAISSLEASVALFKERNHFFWKNPVNEASRYILNYHENDTNNNIYKNYLNNLYYVNSNGSTTKVLASTGTIISSDIISFIFMEGNGVGSSTPAGKSLRVEGKRTGVQNLRLMFPILNPDGSKQEFYYDFSVVVENYTDEDKPEQIYTAEEFMAIASEQTAQDYILMEDIYLYEYIPFSTNRISSLDGNNKVITIMSFDLDLEENSSSISLGLFTIVNDNTTLKNITVNYYHLNKVLINTAKFKTINVAGFAVENRGIITNSHVLATKINPNLPNSPKTNLGFEVVYSSGTTETKIPTSVSSTIAGFVITNSSNGSITNSRVGGTEFVRVLQAQNQTTTENLRVFNISGQGGVAGFVYRNGGTISASFTNNINIENQSDVKMETITSGFAGTNNGTITLSYSKGAYNPLYPNEIRASGSGISTTGIASGFVYTNNGSISDSYSNIMIKDKNGNAGRGSAGFVYSNTTTGLIEKAYTASLTEDRSSGQMNFTGVDESLKILNDGVILNSYYYSPQSTNDNSSTEIEELYSSGVLKISSFTNLEAFYGFSFATINSNDGVWKATSSRGIDLVSANEIAISSRYIAPLPDGDFVFHYVDGYKYGSKNNPIIIRTAEEFHKVMGAETNSSPIEENFDLQSQTISGAYRLVANINLSELSVSTSGDYKLSSTGMSFVKNSVFEGNNLTINNLQMYSTLEYTKNSIGMFASIEGGSVVKNLNIGLISIEANNVQHVGAITGALIDSKLVNINVRAVSSDTSAKILGQNVVGGVVGLVSGNSAVVGLKTENITVEVDFFDRNISRQHFQRKQTLDQFNHSRLSYAGGIVGILDIFIADKYAQQEYFKEDVLSFANSASLHVGGYGEIKAGTAGGVLGYVGVNSFVRDAHYEIYAENESRAQKIVAFKFAAGGLVGELHGGLTQSKIEHTPVFQEEIERNLSVYYNTNQNVARGNMSLFKNTTTIYNPEFVGGLVGRMGSGEISNSYSKANVVMETATFVGGVIGGAGDHTYAAAAPIKRIGNVIIEEVYSFGDIKSGKRTDTALNQQIGGAGGFIGFIEYLKPNTEATNNIPVQFIVNGSNAIVYHSKNVEGMFDEVDTELVLKNVYDFYAYTKIENRFVDATKYYQEVLNKTIESNIIELAEFGTNLAGNTRFAYTTQQFETGGKTYSLKKSTFGTVVREQQDYPLVIEGQVARLNEIANLINDARVMDVIFRNNHWNEYSWERETETLLPKIVFTISNSIFYIEKPEDFLLMKSFPDKIFIMIGGNLEGQRRLIDMSSFNENDLADAIRGFSGLLKGYVEEEEGETTVKEPTYGFKNLKISKALIESTRNGAVFSDFVIAQSGSANSEDGAILVKDADGTIFRNILIENSNLTTTAPNAGLLVGQAQNSIFDTVKVSTILSTDMITVHIDDSNSEENNGQFSAGIIAGKVISSIKTTFRNIEIKTINNNSGIQVWGRTLLADNTFVNTVNIGGVYGSGEQSVEIISTTGEANFINNLGLKFDANSTGDLGVLLPDYYVLNAGLIGGKTENGNAVLTTEDWSRRVSGRIKANGSFKNQTNSAISASVGGLFGSVSGLNISKTEGVLTSDVAINVNNFLENNSIMAVGGVVGNAGSLSMNRVNFGNAKIETLKEKQVANKQIEVISKRNLVYAGGIVGNVRINANITNSKVLSGVKILLDNKTDTLAETVFGGIVGRSDFSGATAATQLSLNGNTFNGIAEILGTKGITAGGVVGAINRQINENSVASKIELNIFGGQIDIQRTSGSAIVAGGILGSSAFGVAEKDKISNIHNIAGNISYGDINLTDDKIGKDDITLGGIVGQGSGGTGSGGVYIENNLSLTTLYSARTADSFRSAALVGDGFATKRGENFYSSQLNLATEKPELAENISYEQMLKKIGDESIESLLYEQADSIKNDNIKGYKLNPHIINDLKPIQEGTETTDFVSAHEQNNTYRRYFMFYTSNPSSSNPAKVQYELNKPISTLKNQAIIGDGIEVIVKAEFGRMFDLIDDKSFVSGISVVIDKIYYPTSYQYEYKYSVDGVTKTFNYPYEVYGGFTAVNQGVVFGVNVKSNATSSANIYSEIVLSNTTLAGGLVGLNKGYISDSFASVNIVNITSKTEKTTTLQVDNPIIDILTVNDNIVFSAGKLTVSPITAGFVGLNQGDIESSYSNGVINAFSSHTYAFGADSRNLRFVETSEQNQVYIEPSVKNSFTITQASNALTEIEVNKDSSNIVEGTTQKTHSFVFGYGADSSNFYDVYATQVSDNDGGQNKPQKLTAAEIFNMNMSNKRFSIDHTKNFGYPSFDKAYKNFNFMNQTTAFGENASIRYVPNLGVLQNLIKNNAQPNLITELQLVNSMSITKDMGYVYDPGREAFSDEVIENKPDFGFKPVPTSSEIKNSNWQPLNLKNIKLHGNGHQISDFRIFLQQSKIAERINIGFFDEIIGSSIENLTLANGEVVSNTYSLLTSVGAFAGKITSSSITGSKNLGVSVEVRKGGIAGGIVGLFGVSSTLKNNINTGNVVSYISLTDSQKVASLENIAAGTLNTKAVAGGIFGHYNTRISETQDIVNHNTNYGLVLGKMPKANESNQYEYRVFTAGIGITSTGLSSVSTIIYNDNRGEARVYADDENLSNSFSSKLIHGLTGNGQTPVIYKEQEISESLFGEGTKAKPYIVSSLQDFYFAYDMYQSTGNFNVLLTTNINLEQTTLENGAYQVAMLESTVSPSNQEINVFGNNNLISYGVYQDDVGKVISNYSLFEDLNEGSNITNLNILGHFDSVYSHVSLLSRFNSGLIKQTNIYGSIVSVVSEKNESIEEDLYIAGVVFNNRKEGNILLSNNYALVKALSGVDAEDLISEEKIESKTWSENIPIGRSAVNIGGIAGITQGEILNSINYGALIGGDGGKGFSFDGSIEYAKTAAEDGRSGQGSGGPEIGRNGKSGTDGGSASTIGGVSYKIKADENSAITVGYNYGIILGGNGGDGGKGQNGGRGGSAIENYQSFGEKLVHAFSGNLYGNIADIYNSLFGSTHNGQIGGSGGAGGNGGNAVEASIAGTANSNNYAQFLKEKTNLENQIIHGKAGAAGLGGNGGAGGSGRFETAWYAFIAHIPGMGSVVATGKYVGVGDGGGAGGSGYAGNSTENLKNQFNPGSQPYVATPGQGNTGGQGSAGDAPNGTLGKTKNKNFKSNLVFMGNPSPYKKMTETDLAFGGIVDAEKVGTATQIGENIGYNTKLPDLKEDESGSYYEIREWLELVDLLRASNSDSANVEYRFTRDFTFSSQQTLETLPNYFGTINGNGKTITVRGRYERLQLLSSNTSGNQNKIKDLTLKLETTGFDSSFSAKSQFIAPGFSLTTTEKVIVEGSVISSKSIPELRERHGVVNIALGNTISQDFNTHGNFKFQFKQTSLREETSTSTYTISNVSAFKEFVSLAENGSTAKYKLLNDISLTPEDVNTFVVESFLGSFDGNNRTITLNTFDVGGNTYAFNSIFGVLGNEENKTAKVSKLKVSGAFNQASIAGINYGTIETIIVGSTNDNLTIVSGDAASIAITNRGTITNVANNINITALAGNAAGIVIENLGLIEDANNFGKIVAGNGANGIDFDDDNDMSESERASYESFYNSVFGKDSQELEQFKASLLNGMNGYSAAGIAIFNYFDEIIEEEDYKENGKLLYGITNARNHANITAGKGGVGKLGGKHGDGGHAGGIVVHNIISAGVDEHGKEIFFKGYIFSDGVDGRVENNGTLQKGLAGGEGAKDGIANPIAAVYLAVDENGVPILDDENNGIFSYLEGFSEP